MITKLATFLFKSKTGEYFKRINYIRKFIISKY